MGCTSSSPPAVASFPLRHYPYLCDIVFYYAVGADEINELILAAIGAFRPAPSLSLIAWAATKYELQADKPVLHRNATRALVHLTETSTHAEEEDALRLMTWLANRYTIPLSVVLCAFKQASKNNSIRMVVWLMEYYHLDAIDLYHPRKGCAYATAWKHGHISLRWPYPQKLVDAAHREVATIADSIEAASIKRTV